MNNKRLNNVIKTEYLLLITCLFLFILSIVYFYQKKASLSDNNLIEKVESLYNNIFIYKDATNRRHMIFGYRNRNFIESIHNPQDTLELPAPYTRFMTMGVLYAADLKSMLFIGMGGGKTSSYMQAFIPELHIMEVELDPDVVKLAKKYFDFQETPRLTVSINDGRKFLMQSDGQYDLIMLDAYRGPFVPFHLLTVEFYQEVKKHLKPGGVVVQNIEPSTMLFDSTVATIAKVFDQVEFYPADGNVITVAYDGRQPANEVLREKAILLQKKYHFRYALPNMLDKRTFFRPQPTIMPLTDDFAPVDSLKAIEKHNKKWE